MTMWNALLSGLLAFALSTAPASARSILEAPTAKAEFQLYGLPVFTSDGLQIGAVAETGTDDHGHMVLLVNMERPLGPGAQVVAIPVELIALRADGIDLFLTAKEVRERLSSAEATETSTP